MERYDIAIIGTGPAGLEAAITAKVRNKRILLLGNSIISAKVEKAHAVRNYLGLPEVSGKEMRETFYNHLNKMDITITEDLVNTVYAMGDYFAIQGHREMYEAFSVILACGITASQTFPGELENLGNGVSYCATCDAALYRKKKTIVIGYSKEEEKEAEFLSEVAEKVYYLPMYQGEVKFDSRIEILTGNKPVAIERDKEMIRLKLENGFLDVDGLFILRESALPSQLVPGLAIEKNHVIVGRDMETNIDGLFACGDITGAPYQYIKAAGEGNVAALSAANYLNKKNK